MQYRVSYRVLMDPRVTVGRHRRRRLQSHFSLKKGQSFSAERFLKAMPYKDAAYPKLAAESFPKADLLK